MNRTGIVLSLVIVVLSAPPAWGGDVTRCWDEKLPDAKRLKCYDAETNRPEPSKLPEETGAPPPSPVAAAASKSSSARMTGYLAQRWGYDLSPEANHLVVRSYNDNYAILRDTSKPNPMPYSPGPDGERREAAVPIDVDHPELKFQISFKARLFDIPAKSFKNDVLVDDAFGLWLGYTQQSHWQLLNSTQSSPFRETNYQPELIVSIHPWLFVRNGQDNDWNWRLFNLGVGHQSNGQGGALSRSWNYAFAQLGFETDNQHGQWSFVLRPWYRFSESASTDDNHDLTDYIGYGDIRATWRKCDWQVSLTARGNPATGKGAAQLDAAFPLWPFTEGAYLPLQWYVQAFTGYGESLIDYNWRQTTFGAGVRLNDRRPQEQGCKPKSSS